MADIEFTGPNQEYDPPIGGNLDETRIPRTTLSTSYANLDSLEDTLKKLLALLDELDNTLDNSLDIKGLPIDPLDERLNEAHELSWPSELGPTKNYVSYRYYKYISLQNTTASNVIKKAFEESARDVGGTKALDIKKITDSTRNEALLIQEFTKTYVGKLIDAAEHRTVELFQDWSQSALYHTGRFQTLFSTGVQTKLPDDEVSSLSSPEARNGQAVFKVKLNDVNRKLAESQDYLDKNFTQYAPVFYQNFLGPALQFRLNVSSKFNPTQGIYGKEVSRASDSLDANLVMLQGDQIKRNAIYDKYMHTIYDQISEQNTYQNYITQLAPLGQSLPADQGFVDVQDTPDETQFFEDAGNVVPDSDPTLSISSPHNALIGRDAVDAHPIYFLKAGDTLSGNLELEEDVRVDAIIPHLHKHNGIDGSVQIDGKDILGGTLNTDLIDTNEKPPRPTNLHLCDQKTAVATPGLSVTDIVMCWDGVSSLQYEIQISPIANDDTQPEIEPPNPPPPPPPPPPVTDGRIWSTSEFAAGDFWWRNDGSEDSDHLLYPPDPNAFTDGDDSSDAAWYAGGSDGTFIYQLAIDGTGQWWVDKFDRDLTILLDRWRITGWTSAPGGDQWEAFDDIQHVCADENNVVVVTDKINSSIEWIGIETSVFDLSGALLNQWSYALSDLDEFGSRYSINTRTGSYTDGTFVYFWIQDPIASDGIMVKVELATGDLTQLFSSDSVTAQSPDPDNIYLSPGGVIEKDGDLILAGSDVIARVHQDGTLVWITQSPSHGSMALQAITHSGRDSIWAGVYPEPFVFRAEEYTYDGAYVRSINVPAGSLQSWFVPDGPPPPTLIWPTTPRIVVPVVDGDISDSCLELLSGEDHAGSILYVWAESDEVRFGYAPSVDAFFAADGSVVLAGTIATGLGGQQCSAFRAPDGEIYAIVSAMGWSGADAGTAGTRVYKRDSTTGTWSTYADIERIGFGTHFENGSASTGIPFFTRAGRWVLPAPVYIVDTFIGLDIVREGVWISDDNGITWGNVVSKGYYFFGSYGHSESRNIVEFNGELYWATAGDPPAEGDDILWVSDDDGSTWSIYWAGNDFAEAKYTFIPSIHDGWLYITQSDTVYRTNESRSAPSSWELVGTFTGMGGGGGSIATYVGTNPTFLAWLFDGKLLTDITVG